MTILSDFSTPSAQVRLLISDIDSDDPIFNDEAIDSFLKMSSNRVRLAAATALLVIAVNEVLVQKRIRLLDLSTDGPSEASALRDLAAQYRKDDETSVMSLDGIGYLSLPEGIDRFDRRSNAAWAALQSGDR